MALFKRLSLSLLSFVAEYRTPGHITVATPALGAAVTPFRIDGMHSNPAQAISSEVAPFHPPSPR